MIVVTHERRAKLVPSFYNLLTVIDKYFIVLPGPRSPTWTRTHSLEMTNTFKFYFKLLTPDTLYRIIHWHTVDDGGS